MSTALDPAADVDVAEHPQLQEFGTRSFGAVVIGQTVAGLRTASKLAEKGVSVKVIGHEAPPTAAVGFNADSRDPLSHSVDTLVAGKLLNEATSVQQTTLQAASSLASLADAGCQLEVEKNPKKIDGHTSARTFFGLPDTPTAVFDHLKTQASDSGVDVDERNHPVTLLVHNGTVGGVLLINPETGGRVIVQSPVVVVATGDYTGLYKQGGGSGSGLGLAFSAGAFLRDMEFLVFDGESPIYSLGGIDVDPHTGESLISGLFAAGDAAGGYHGAGSLPGNRLLVDIVSADVVTDSVMQVAQTGVSSRKLRKLGSEHSTRLETLLRMRGPVPASELLADLRRVFTELVGTSRDEESLLEATDKLVELQEACVELGVAENPSLEQIADVLALESLLYVAEAVVRAATARTESRGHHRREDYPETDAAWRETILSEVGSFGVITTTTRPLADLPEGLRERVE